MASALAARRLYQGAPIRIISGSATGNADFWFVKGDSPLKTIKDATDATTIVYSSNGASTHRCARPDRSGKGKPVATGGPAATLTVALSGQVDIGWTSPPLGFDMLDDGRIRIFARANDVPSLKDQTIRVNIANANSLKARRDVFVRFVKAFGETIDWIYSSDPKALRPMSPSARRRRATPPACAMSSLPSRRSTQTP